MRAAKNHIVGVLGHLLMMMSIMSNHNIMASAQAVSTYSARLINTLSSVSNQMEGRLEIYYNGIWGTVCDDGFTNASARVACASLGYGYIGAFIGNRHGGGSGKIWLDDVTCTGSEYGIEKCPHRAWDSHDCSHGEDVSISCGTSGAFAIRLINSLSSVNKPNEGRLEIFYNGVWGTVCDDSFTNASARVACNSLGYGYIGTVITNRHGVGTGSIWLDEVTCRGTESSIDRCSHSAWGSHDCTHAEDIAISCRTTSRLVNSLSTVTNPNEGRLEIYYAGEWGTVCDDSFTNISARVACHSLGFGDVGTFVANRHGSGTGRIWLDNVICDGTELSIDRCAHNAWGTNDCSHNEDVSIRCGNTPDYAVRLVNRLTDDSTAMEGRLEIYYSGLWGTVCDDSFTNASARVACASLGFGYIGRFIGSRRTIGTGQIWLDEVICRGTESGLEKCQHSSWGTHNCGHSEDVSIVCGNTPDYSVRLINSVAGDVNPMEGQLEIYYSGVWGAVCSDELTDTDATDACAILGFGYTGKFVGNRYGFGQGHIWSDDIICNGTERDIVQCWYRAWGSHYCRQEQLVSIKCGDTEDYAVRLINSQNPDRNPMEGRLEIYFAGVWGSVCDDGFTNITAQVVCASLGYGYAGTYMDRSHYGAGIGQIWLDDVKCTGGEPSIDKCTHRPWGLHDCSHGEDVGIKCGIVQNFTMRLVNSLSHITNPKEGRLEIYYSGSWGTVCNDNFTDFSARVACASLGFGRTGTFIGNRHGPGTGQIVLDEVNCAGTEQSIDDCTHSPWGTNDCTHSEDVSISCGTTTRLVNSLYAANNPREGRLEIYYDGRWGTVCRSRVFTEANSKVVCSSLGFGYNGTFIGNRHGNGTGGMWLNIYACVGTEQSITMCPRSSLGSDNCPHREGVSVRCGDTRDFAVRLINPFGNNSKEGRLEIYYSGIWGTVCDDSFTDVSAGVACASLGIGNNGTVIGNRHGSGTDAIWLDDVECTGTESGIDSCAHKEWGVHDCVHGEDVSISCGM